MSTWNFEYKYVGGGKVSRPVTAAVEVTDAERAVIRDAVANWRTLAKEPGLHELLARADAQLRERAAEELCAQGDGYALRCRDEGKSPFDGEYRLTVKICEPDDEV